MSEPWEHHATPHAGKHRPRPEPWAKFRAGIRYRWLVPLMFLDWLAEWAAWALSRLSFLELLEYCGSLSLLVAVIFYFLDAPERVKLRHYQAWQVINTAQGKGGSGGRIDALRELNEDGVPLIGVDLTDAFLQGVRLEHASLRRANFGSADMRNADLRYADLEQTVFATTNLRGADLSNANLADASMKDADLTGVDLNGANLDRADLRDADLTDSRDWKSISSIRRANVHGVQNAPDGFVAWAMGKGAVDIASDADWSAAQTRP